MPLLQVENVSFSYDKKIPVIKNVSLSIDEGEYVAIVGHNGSGKSTLAKLFNGLIKADEGEIQVDGFSPADKKSVFEVRKRVGVVFQNPDNQLVASIVEDDVAFGPENLGVPRKEIGERIDFALSAVGMEKFRRSSPTRLSGGQKQRIAIAGVLALKPKILVLDESTAMLDPHGRKEVLETVLALQKEYDLTVVLITHHMNEAAKADRVVVLNEGKIFLDGTPAETLTQVDALRSVGMDVPPSVELLVRLGGKEAGLEPDAFDEESCAARIAAWLAEGN
jgi:energy-coupling factor transport system ATP-binding protein